MDGIFQQTKPLDQLVGEMTLFSFDLKSATETLVTLFEILFDQLFASSCVNSCLAYNVFHAPGDLLISHSLLVNL